MASYKDKIGYHEKQAAGKAKQKQQSDTFTYTFGNYFHPFVGKLIGELNRGHVSDMLDPGVYGAWQDPPGDPQPPDTFFKCFPEYTNPGDATADLEGLPRQIDFSVGGPYANYNWELFYHIPMTVAVHLSKQQRFAEAQRWFHLIFDPTSNDAIDPPKRFWKLLAFRKDDDPRQIDYLLALMSKPTAQLTIAQQLQQQDIIKGYEAIFGNKPEDKPFRPFAIARTRLVAFQYSVVMKYLDNLIDWGDSLFEQDTVESINEATQVYVLAANILGPRPQRIPAIGTVRPMSFAELQQQAKNGLDAMSNVLVALEGQFPFNLISSSSSPAGSSNGGQSLFGVGQTLYFCIPHNAKLLGYWDTVADRLFKIRHCMNIAGIVRPLALFDPPIDPGMLVKAAAAGVDIGSIVSGLNQPVGPVRALPLIQKSLELCSEVRSLGGALLAALEKGDAENLALIRQRHEIQLQQMARDVRFLQWKSAQEATTSLLTSRATTLERLHYYQRLLGLPADPNAPDTIALDHRDLTEENFDEAYSNLVGQYDKPVAQQKLPALKITGANSPAQQSGATGQGRLYLNANEDSELNTHLPNARDSRLAGSVANAVASVLTFIPEINIDLHYWGLGGNSKVFGGSKLSDAIKIGAEIAQMVAGWEQDQAGMAARAAGYERRADDWLLQYNLAAHELMQNGRQILTSLIAEQISKHEYENIQKQIANAQEIDEVLHDKFTNQDLYLWMQGEISRLYYEYYRFAFDTARKAERTMKQELARPELDSRDFVKFNYWDGGRKGLLSGEALHLDVKQMEVAYHDNNKRELELIRHVSLRQLNPLALLALKATGTCQVTVPEWLYDMDCPGHYMRRIKTVALSIPAVVGSYTSVNCTLSLLRSSVRTSPIAGDDYARQGLGDERFTDYVGAIQSIVTSSANNDSGLFEANLHDERFLPFEGAGAESTWKLDLPKPADYPAFDYSTISDVILHIRYTARQGVEPTKVIAALNDQFQDTGKSTLGLLFSLRHDFPDEWTAFISSTNPFSLTIRKSFFPYFTQGKTVTITAADLYGMDVTKHKTVYDCIPDDAKSSLSGDWQFDVTPIPSDETQPVPNRVLTRTAKDVFMIVKYSIQ